MIRAFGSLVFMAIIGCFFGYSINHYNLTYRIVLGVASVASFYGCFYYMSKWYLRGYDDKN